jgi:hypothetical protein
LFLPQAEMFVALPHSGNDEGVNLLVELNSFNLALLGTDRPVPNYPTF